MKKILVLGVACLLLVCAVTVWAGPADQIRGRMDGLQRRIDEGAKSGTLTVQEVQKIQNKLNAVLKSFDRAVQNGLSQSEIKHFNQRLDDLNKELSKEKHDLESTRSAGRIEKQIGELQKRIDTGSRVGSLTPVETKKLQSRLDAVRSQYDRAQKDGRLSDAEIRSIRTKLDNLSKSINKERQDMERSR